MNNQKQIIALIVVASSFTSFLAGYVLTRPQGSSTDGKAGLLARFDATTAAVQTTSIPMTPGSLFQISGDDTLAAVADATTNSVVYYHRNIGFVSRVSLVDRSSTMISNVQLPRLVNITWSPDRKKVVSKYSTFTTSAQPFVFKYYNYETGTNKSLPSSVIDAAFSPDSQQLALVEALGDEADVVLADPDGSVPRTILRTRLNNLSLTWPAAHALSLAVRNGTETDLYLLTDTGSLTTLVSRAPNFALRWSPDGTTALYSLTMNQMTQLHALTVATAQDQVMPISATATGCGWRLDSRSVICAIDGDRGITLKSANLADRTTSIIAGDLIFSPEDVFLSHLDDYVIMVSRGDHHLSAVRLSQ